MRNTTLQPQGCTGNLNLPFPNSLMHLATVFLSVCLFTCLCNPPVIGKQSEEFVSCCITDASICELQIHQK